MKRFRGSAVLRIGAGMALLTALAGCFDRVDAQSKYTLTVESSDPTSGIAIAVSPKDDGGETRGTTKFVFTYSAGMSVTLTAPLKAASHSFVEWSGCKSASAVTCKVTMNADQTVIAKYAPAYVLTIESADPADGVPIEVSRADKNNLGDGTTKLTRTYFAGTSVTLTAPSKARGNDFDEWTGCRSASTVHCHLTMSANATVTALYAPPTATAPTVAVTPSATSVTTAQSLPVIVTVSGESGKPKPAGTVTLSGGTYISTATLSSGKGKFKIPVGALAQGNDKLTAAYIPGSASYSLYKSAAGTATVKVTAPPANYTLTVDSAHPSSGITINAYPADNHNTGFGTTPFMLTYKAGATVQLTAVSPSGGYYFLSWSGCATSTNAGACTLQMNGNKTVTANYNQANITGVSIAPNPAVATIGTPLQLTATVQGTGNFSNSVNWSLSCPACSNLSAGTLNSTGLYITPYPAPASVTVTATSTQTPSVSGSIKVTLSPPATSAGPSLTVDTGNQTHAISPYIYGMNAYSLQTSVAQDANITVARWGGDNTSRYNYLTNTSNSASDYYFLNGEGSGGLWPDGDFSDFVTAGAGNGIKTLGTVPVLGWVTNSSTTACSFPESQFTGQQSYVNGCGNGTDSNGTELYGDDAIAATTSISEPPPAPPAASDVNQIWADATWPGGWVASLVAKSETGASGGVAFWDLDNEPAWWDAVHRDVHPVASTYDEVTDGGIGTALAIKTADPTAQVNGPVIDYWWNYFYSKKDIENGWGTGPCYEPWQNPVDREAHGGVPMIEYYLQQFKAAEATYGIRLLDSVDLHTYFAATYNGNGVGLAPAGDTGEQEARLNSTRVFWDPTYTDPNYPQPNYTTDPNYTSSCSPPLQAPQLIPMMQTWVANDYPGTKTAITEYNWGGQESINGAVAQADILGIFGAYGLDLATLWGPPDPGSQVPGLMAFEIYRNYDGNKSTFGDTALASASASQGELSVYGALRTADGAITIMVVNKTYGALTSTLTLDHLTVSPGVKAQVFEYSAANLNAIVSASPVAVTPPASGGSASTITTAFPGQSITLLVIPSP
ncbi:MAG: glycoside hydrolase family 44 protein [Terracidiphilus sp.]